MKQLFLFSIIFLSTLSLAANEKKDAFGMNERLGRGINIGNTFEAPSENEWGNPWNPAYLKMIADLGFSHVRLPIRWETPERTMTEPPYTISEEFLKRIKSVIDEALKNKLHIIINMHHHETLVNDPAGQKERFLSQWRQIADYFKTYPDSLLFELLNEPQKELANADLWNQYTTDALSEIRKTNPDRFVLICSSNWSGVRGLESLKLPDDKNLILTVHYYDPFNFTHQGADFANMEHITGIKWLDTEIEREVIRLDFQEVKAFSEKHQIPVHVGEFGSYYKADIDSRVRWTTYMSRFFEELGFSWAYWEFSSTFGIYNPLTGTFLQPLVNALLHNKLPEPVPVKTSLIYESDFEKNEMDGCYFQITSGAVGSSSIASDRFNVNIIKAGTDAWDIQFLILNIPIEKNSQYKLSFTAYASKECTILSYIGKNASPWDMYSNYNSFKCSDKEDTYSYIFTMDSSDDLQGRIAFDLGAIPAPATISLSNIKLEKIEADYTSNEFVDKPEVCSYFDTAQNNLIINNDESYNNATVFSISGSLISSNVLTQGVNYISSTQWNQGIYIVVLEGNDFRHIQKIRKSKFN